MWNVVLAVLGVVGLCFRRDLCGQHDTVALCCRAPWEIISFSGWTTGEPVGMGNYGLLNKIQFRPSKYVSPFWIMFRCPLVGYGLPESCLEHGNMVNPVRLQQGEGLPGSTWVLSKGERATSPPKGTLPPTLPWHLTVFCLKRKMIFQVPSSSCYVSGREGSKMNHAQNMYIIYEGVHITKGSSNHDHIKKSRAPRAASRVLATFVSAGSHQLMHVLIEGTQRCELLLLSASGKSSCLMLLPVLETGTILPINGLA